MKETTTFLDALIKALLDASVYNKNDQCPPAAVLWPDKDRQWGALLPLLRRYLPILTLGKYMPEHRTGPAYYLRCMISRTLARDLIPADQTPIIYLPGVSKGEIRAVEECPQELQPLAELQYRGVLWVQKNGRDWTVPAFLQSKLGGLGIEIGGDQATKEALSRALLKLTSEPLEKLNKAAPLRAPFFDALLTPDETRSLLLWLDAPEEYPLKVAPEEWEAFRSICLQKYGFHPKKDGPISAVQRMAAGSDNWPQVWSRYKEAPRSYPGIPDLLTRARSSHASQMELGWSEFWLQDNQAAEDALRLDLRNIPQTTVDETRQALISLEKLHGHRRDWVWASLGQTPLADALWHLVRLAELSGVSLTGDSVSAIADAYRERGWQVDRLAIQAQVAVSKPEDREVVNVTVRALYKSWLEATAEAFQRTISDSYPHEVISKPDKGTCVLFSDALRMDVGQTLARQLRDAGYPCDVNYHLGALPTITATAKPAILDTGEKITGQGGKKLTPRDKTRSSALTAEGYRKILSDEGYQILKDSDLGDPTGIAWTEIGEIDTYGHNHGCKLAHHLDGEIEAIQNRVQILLDYGWKRVCVVTDHGWLLLPGGLPKTHLPEHLTEVRKGRCALLKDTSSIDYDVVPWFWDRNVSIVLAPTIHCFEAGKEYEHGGISPQECVTPVIMVSRAEQKPGQFSIEDVKWRGLRCIAVIAGKTHDIMFDIRSKAGDDATSLVSALQTPDEKGHVSLLIEDEERLGEAAFLVVVDSSSGTLLAQSHVTIGE